MIQSAQTPSLPINPKVKGIEPYQDEIVSLFNMCIFKENQHVASKFCITDMDNLDSIFWF